MVPLSNSRKFWYDEGLSQPIGSITTPDQAKRVWLDPRMTPLLRGRRVLLVDDVLSSGRSIRAVLRLLAAASVRPDAIACAMLQGQGWRAVLDQDAPGIPVHAAIRTPLLRRNGEGWQPDA
jgi:adenine/guanine phosphoribosyltransferase-like PRPP-binding protein